MHRPLLNQQRLTTAAVACSATLPRCDDQAYNTRRTPRALLTMAGGRSWTRSNRTAKRKKRRSRTSPPGMSIQPALLGKTGEGEGGACIHRFCQLQDTVRACSEDAAQESEEESSGDDSLVDSEDDDEDGSDYEVGTDEEEGGSGDGRPLSHNHVACQRHQ